jgi:capsular polysaccharide transport system permease protein
MQALEQTRAAAATQHFYIVPFVRPALPERSTYPQRLYAIGTVAVACFLFWLVAILIGRAVREHFV